MFDLSQTNTTLFLKSPRNHRRFIFHDAFVWVKRCKMLKSSKTCLIFLKQIHNFFFKSPRNLKTIYISWYLCISKTLKNAELLKEYIYEICKKKHDFSWNIFINININKYELFFLMLSNRIFQFIPLFD